MLGSRSRINNAGDRMYAEALSTALAVHLQREYGAAVLGPKRQYGGLPRESWCVLWNIFKINWTQT
jgi:hypothetical protein